MATVTLIYRAFEQAGVVFEEDYDDVSLTVARLRCINTTDQWAAARATAGELARRNQGLTYTHFFPPNQTTFVAIPQTAAARLQRTAGNRGRPDGLELELIWPAINPQA